MTTIACCLLKQNCLNTAERNELKHNFPSLCVFERKIMKLYKITQSLLCFQDAHEFLSQCLDQLKEDMEKLNKTWKSEPVPNEDNSPGRASDDLSATKVYTCPVISNLEFEVQHSIICKM